MKKKKVLFWSGGLSSLTVLKKLLSETAKNDIILICLLNKEGNELGYTGIPEEVLQIQAKYLGIKLVRLYQDKMSEKVLLKLKEQNFEFYCGTRDGKFLETPFLTSLDINTPLLNKSYLEILDNSHSRAILTSVEDAQDQRLLGKELIDIAPNLDLKNETQKIDSFVIFDPLLRIRIPFSKNIIVEKDGHYICKIRGV